jgi:hypothetical protein
VRTWQSNHHGERRCSRAPAWSRPAIADRRMPCHHLGLAPRGPGTKWWDSSKPAAVGPVTTLCQNQQHERSRMRDDVPEAALHCILLLALHQAAFGCHIPWTSSPSHVTSLPSPHHQSPSPRHGVISEPWLSNCSIYAISMPCPTRRCGRKVASDMMKRLGDSRRLVTALDMT